MIDLENIFVAEYSVSQDAFHVSALGHSIETNRRMIVEKAKNDYQIFWLFETGEEANAACDKMRRLQNVGDQTKPRECYFDLCKGF